MAVFFNLLKKQFYVKLKRIFIEPYKNTNNSQK